ncbi:MAG: hypothetical protein BWY65_01619 [Firmicutes bacterium ADurb.Bin373]|nr:MAG: hypothetical protein BWY65_01619 [Firmicutes bacterium ADurb.Bin373]
MLRPLQNAPVGYIPAHALLGVGNHLELSPEAGHKAQGHGQNQRQGGDDPPEEIDELVRGHHGVVAGKPADHRDEHHRRRDAVDDGFQRQRIAAPQVGEDGPALMVEGGVDQRRYSQHGQHVF